MWAKQVWLKDGQLQTYSNRWEPIWPAPEPVAVTGVSLNESSATIQTEGTLQLTATVTPSDATDKKVTWSSSNDSIAHVSSNGLVTAGSEAGNTTITVTTRDGGFTDTCDITVSGGSEPEVQSVSFAGWEEGATRSVYQSSPDTVALFLINPYTASNLHVNVTSSNESIVSINHIEYWDEPQEYGVGYVYFNYNGVGTATITITSEDNPNATSTVYLQVMQDVLVQSVSNLDPSSNNVYLYSNPSSTYNVATFEYYPTNATAVEYGDVVISLKEGETSIGDASIQNFDNWTATIQFYCHDCNVGDSAVYEIYPATNPSTKLELTLTVAEGTESITIDDSQISVTQWSTASRSFTYLPTTSDIGSIIITNDNDSIATPSIVKDSDWNGTLYVEWLNEGETTLWIERINLSSIEIPVVVSEVQQIPVESISNLSETSVTVNEYDTVVITADYLPVNATSVSNVSFVPTVDDIANCYIINLNEGQFEIVIDWENAWSTQFDIQIDGVSTGLTIDVTVNQVIDVQSVTSLSQTTNVDVALGGTTTLTFDYLPTNANTMNTVSFSVDGQSVWNVIVDIISFNNGTATVQVEWASLGAYTIDLEHDLSPTGLSFSGEVVSSIAVQSISNLPQSAVIVNEWWSNTFTFDYLPANATDFSGISFVDSTNTSTSATYNNGTATVTVEWLNYTTTNSASVWIQLDWVSAWSVDVDVRAYANILVDPVWAGSVSPSVIYIPYGGTTDSSDPSVNPCTINIHPDQSSTVVDTVTVTATAESWYTFNAFDPALASEWYDPSVTRDVAKCYFNQNA